MRNDHLKRSKECSFGHGQQSPRQEASKRDNSGDQKPTKFKIEEKVTFNSTPIRLKLNDDRCLASAEPKTRKSADEAPGKKPAPSSTKNNNNQNLEGKQCALRTKQETHTSYSKKEKD